MTPACARSESTGPCGLVIVYVCDSLRRDHLSCYGYGRRTSPCMEELAREGIVFEQAFAECTWTRPSAASLLTSLYPPTHGVVTFADGMSAWPYALPAVMRGMGFCTVGVSAMGNVSTPCGFAHGFDTFVDLYKDEGVLRRRGEGLKRKMFRMVGVTGPVAETRSEDINQRALDLLDGPLKGRAAFLFLWSTDTHDPYDPPPQDRLFTSGNGPQRLTVQDLANLRAPENLAHARDLYDCEVHANDRTLGELMEALRRRGLYEGALIVLVADHGEALGEHGLVSHGHTPYDVRMAIPMIVKLPGCRHAGRRVRHMAQLVDVAPTVLDALGASAPSAWQGRSLLAAVEGRAEARTCAFCHANMMSGVPQYAAVRTACYKYIECSASGNLGPVRRDALERLLRRLRRRGAPPSALYDLALDPGEERPRATTRDLPLRLALARRLHAWREGCELLRRRLRLRIGRKVELQDPGLLEHLERLGYA